MGLMPEKKYCAQTFALNLRLLQQGLTQSMTGTIKTAVRSSTACAISIVKILTKLA